jgi:hypothetical protein
MNISIRCTLLRSSHYNAKFSVEREPVIGQTLIDMRGRKPAWEGISGSEQLKHLLWARKPKGCKLKLPHKTGSFNERSISADFLSL